MDLSIVWILFIAWASSCFFYFLKIRRIAHSNRLSVFSPLSRYNRTLRSMVKRLYIRMLIITLVFFLAIAAVYYMRDTSVQLN